MLPREEPDQAVLEDEDNADSCVEAAEVPTHQAHAEVGPVNILPAPPVLWLRRAILLSQFLVLAQVFRRDDLSYEAGEQALLNARSVRRGMIDEAVFDLGSMLFHPLTAASWFEV